MTRYRWGKDTSRRPWWRLRPEKSPDWHVLDSIATVYTLTLASTGKRAVSASYSYYSSTGNANYGSAQFKSVPRAKRWCETQLAKFWEPPTILEETKK